MRVTVIRHAKVKRIWKKSYSSTGFDEDCRLYDTAMIEEVPAQKDHDTEKIYISTLKRTGQTAKMMFGEREYHACDLLNEVPLRSAFDTGIKLPLWFWNTAGRVQWFTGNKRQPEIRKQTVDRAERFVKMMIDKGEDCILVTHGFFMHTLISVIKDRGFKADNTGVHYKNGEAVTLTL